MNLVRRWLAAALVSVLAWGLVGCSEEGDPEPDIAPTKSAASTPSESPSESPTSGAASLSARDQQRLFLKDYFVAITDAIGSGDVRLFLGLSSPECQNCQVIARNLSEAYAGGGRIEGGSWSLSDMEYDKQDDFGHIWNVEVTTAEEKWVNRSGEVTKTVTADVVRMALALTRTDDGWQVREMRLR